MLPVFAQFAGVMFFLAGLGILNVLWLPLLDISFDLQQLGLIIRAPHDLVMWLLHQIGINAYWPTVYLSIGGGLFIFLLGTFAWLSARSQGRHVADFWVYRISRHPQYLGWILWTYGLYLLLMRGLYPKRSWGIDGSLPWLVSTMVIIGVAMVEELSMSRQHGKIYDEYRKRTPFLLPVPAYLGRALRWPFRTLFGKEWPERPREVAIVLSLATAVLIGASALFYGGGIEWVAGVIQSEETQRGKIETLCNRMKESTNHRERYALSGQISGYGQAALPCLVTLLETGNSEQKQIAAQRLGELRLGSCRPFASCRTRRPGRKRPVLGDPRPTRDRHAGSQGSPLEDHRAVPGSNQESRVQGTSISGRRGGAAASCESAPRFSDLDPHRRGRRPGDTP